MKDPINPVSVEIVTQKKSMGELAVKMNAMYDSWVKATQRNKIQCKDIGDYLLEAKSMCKHGEWYPWLEANAQFSRETARKFMAVARNWSKIEELSYKSQNICDLPLSLSEAIRLIGVEAEIEQDQEDTEENGTEEAGQEAENDEDLPEPTAPPPSPPHQNGTPVPGRPVLCGNCKRSVRVGQPLPAKCKECKDLAYPKNVHVPSPAVEEPLKDDAGKPVPNRLIPVFHASKAFSSAVLMCRKAGNLLREVEATVAYKIMDDIHSKNQSERKLFSSSCYTAASMTDAVRPSIVCQECGGEHEPSVDSDPCVKCGGKGFLTKEETDD